MAEPKTPEKSGTSALIAKWLGGSGVVIIVAFLASGGKLLDSFTNQADRAKAEQEQHDADVKKSVATELRFERIAEKAVVAYDFAICWPRGNCPEISQLPVDDQQNRELDHLKIAVQRNREFALAHCIEHAVTGGMKFDCNELQP